jgi:hypothetical protein
MRPIFQLMKAKLRVIILMAILKRLWSGKLSKRKVIRKYLQRKRLETRLKRIGLLEHRKNKAQVLLWKCACLKMMLLNWYLTVLFQTHPQLCQILHVHFWKVLMQIHINKTWKVALTQITLSCTITNLTSKSSVKHHYQRIKNLKQHLKTYQWTTVKKNCQNSVWR